MLYLFTGTDREKARAELNKAIAKVSKKGVVVRISDANSVADLQGALQGGGMFGGDRVVVFEGVLSNEEMRAIFLEALPRIKDTDENFFVFEEKPDAATRKQLEKYAENSERFDSAKEKREDGGIFEMANALKRADKKALWVGYQRALARDDAPEAIHGVLFWAAKQAMLSREDVRSRKLVAQLAELPHEARRNGVELEYELERFLLENH